jgi:class 3 adenylate cyclase/predicted ATPase
LWPKQERLCQWATMPDSTGYKRRKSNTGIEGPLESVGAWLNRLGLGAYEMTFEANRVDLEVAAQLSDADLKDLGIRPLGDRKRLLQAIAELRSSGAQLRRHQWERRHLTVMFCDLKGSTVLATQLDPEDLASVIGAFQHCCADIIAHYEGFIARYLGDGILVYFGYPQAREDDTERAVRAALAIIEDISSLEPMPGLRIQVRVGIATGPVVVGDSSDGAVLERHGVVGQTPNLAARLQAVADPNSPVISESTYRLAGHVFECVALKPLSLAGFAAPIDAWSVVRERPFSGRFEARRTVGLTPYVGRTADLAVLTNCWRLAISASGQVVSISGDPGIGKSRIVQELADRIDQPHLRIDYFGSDYLRNSPLSPVIAQIERDAGIALDDPPEDRRAKLEASLASTPRACEAGAAAVLASLISLPPAAADPPPDPDLAVRKRRTFQIIVDLIAERAAREPILVVCEELHWFDPTTLEMLTLLIKRIQTLPVLMILTFRPEFTSSWAGRHVTSILLERLDREAGARLVERVAQDKAVPSEVLDQIVARSDGNPLFIEELTKAILTASLNSAVGDTLTLTDRIPETLQESLIAKLDRLQTAREILQVGAAIGREFREDLLEAVTAIDRADLLDKLEQAITGDLLYRHAPPSGTVYVYKHALVQDAAYETILHSRRRDIHKRIAEALEVHFPATTQSQPELLAQHWQRDTDIRKAIHYWVRAGKWAAERSAVAEANAHLRQALQLVETLPAGSERDGFELEITARLGGVLRAVEGPAATATGEAFGRAKELCRQTGDNTLLAPCLAGLYGYHLVRAENAAAGEAARELLALAEARHDRLYQMIGHRAVGAVLCHTGHFAEAREHLERSLALYDPVDDGPLAFLYGTDHAQTASSFLTFVLRMMGFPDQANLREELALTQAKELGHLYSLVQTHMFRGVLRVVVRDWEAGASVAGEMLELIKGHSFRMAVASSGFCLAACRPGHGRLQQRLEELQEAAAVWWSTGALNYRPMHLAFIAEAHAAAGDPLQGLKTLEEALMIVEATDERWMEAELHRLVGELRMLLENPRLDEVESCFRKAIGIATRQSAGVWELRAATSLASLLHTSGRTDEAGAILAPAYDRFTEGLDSPDMRMAREILGRLGLRR